MEPQVQFDFALQHEQVAKTMLFEQPIQIITTTKLNEVPYCLEQIKNFINKGYYAAGFMSYEATYAFYNIGQTVVTDFPLLWFGVFHKPCITKNRNISTQKAFTLNWKIEQPKDQYIQTVETIQEEIHKGKIEQINYTVPFTTTFHGSKRAYYEQLILSQQANYNAFVQFEDIAILSASPELFLKLEKDTITVRPMKGTIDRGLEASEDERKRISLLKSEKNLRENEMILRLMEDELQKVCDKTKVIEHFTIEKYPTVYQMTSAIEGIRRKNVHPVDLITTLFPPASITGTPKKEAIKLISTYEKENRNVYCGIIGYITPEYEALFNVAIRTVLINKNRAKYFAGGAITKRSLPEEEYEEVWTKAKLLETSFPPFQLLETGLIEKGTFFLKEQHIKRLKKSANYFNIKFNEKALRVRVLELERRYNKGSWRLRLLMDKRGKVTTEVLPIEETPKQTKKVLLATTPIDRENVFLYHKTTERSMFDSFRRALNDEIFDVLLWNEKREITEFTIGNIVVELDGKLYTPPVQCGLLPGTFRQQLLDTGTIKEATITIDTLKNATNLWLINSVRKWVPVEIIEHNFYQN